MTAFLNIIIPTFNRYDFLNESVTRIINSTLRSTKSLDISITILDNNSTDYTYEVYKLFKHYSFVNYIKNETNIGVEKNIYKALTLQSCNWTWLFGDDEVVADNAIEKIYSILENANSAIDLFFINYGQLNSNLTQLLSSHVAKTPNDWMGRWNGTDGLVNCKGVFDLIGFITSIIIKADISQNAIDYTNYSSLYDHSASIWDATSKSCISIMPPGLMYQRQQNQRSWESAETGNSKPGYQSFISFVHLLNDLLINHPALGNDIFEKLTSKVGIYEPLGDNSFINTYIWFFEMFARRSIHLSNNQPEIISKICNSITDVIPIIQSSTAQNYIKHQIDLIRHQ